VLALAAAGCRRDAAAQDVHEIEKAFYGLRDAVLQGDDEAFFRLHSRAARERAVAEFPLFRSSYAASPPEARKAFQQRFRVTDEEFLKGDPRDLTVRLLPWRSGWRERMETLRITRVKDVRLDTVELPGGGTERVGKVFLDVTREPGSPATAALPNDIPPVVFVKDPEGWRRKSFFAE
jgi:hypothetical protein